MKINGRARMGKNGRLVVPANVREACNLMPGDEILFEMGDEGVLMTTLRHRITNAQRRSRAYPKSGRSVVDEFLAERRVAAREKAE